MSARSQRAFRRGRRAYRNLRIDIPPNNNPDIQIDNQVALTPQHNMADVPDRPNFNGQPFIGPLLPGGMSQAEYAYQSGLARKRRRKRKKTGTVIRPPGYQVYKPTGTIAGIIGRGGYFTDALSAMGRSAKRMVPAGAFSRLGAAGGGAIGGGFGASLGKVLGQGVADIAGFGAYTVSQNSLVSQLDEGVQTPSFGSMGQATMMEHRCFIQDIVTPATPANFNIQSFPINPGQVSTFPWLSAISGNFEQYQIMGMIFHFKSLCTDSGATLQMGSVVMATDYDPNDVPYRTKQEMENSQYCVSVKPSLDCVHIIECDPAVTQNVIKTIRRGAFPANADKRNYDHGNFQIATVGLPGAAGQVIGELWCTYQIALYKPQLPTEGHDHWDLPFSTITSALPFGVPLITTLLPNEPSSIGCFVLNNTIHFPTTLNTGNYQILFAAGGNNTALGTALTATLTNCIAAGQSLYNAIAGGGQNVQFIRLTISITGANATVQLNNSATFPAVLTKAILEVSRVADNFLL